MPPNASTDLPAPVPAAHDSRPLSSSTITTSATIIDPSPPPSSLDTARTLTAARRNYGILAWFRRHLPHHQNHQHHPRRRNSSSLTHGRRVLTIHSFLHRPFDRFLCLYMLAIISVTIYFRVRFDCSQATSRLCTWLVVNAAITFVRITGWISVHSLHPDANLSTLRRVLTWTFRFVNLIALSWSIVGLVFLRQLPSLTDPNNSNSTSSDSPDSNQSQPSSPNDVTQQIRDLVLAIIAIELVVLAVTIIVLSCVFFLAMSLGVFTSQGATREQIDKLTTFKFSANQSPHSNHNTSASSNTNDAVDARGESSAQQPNDENNNSNNHDENANINNNHDDLESCIICLEDYEDGDLLKELPCSSNKHVFHSHCIDEWLIQNSSCPICRDNPFRDRDKDEPKNDIEDGGNSNRRSIATSAAATAASSSSRNNDNNSSEGGTRDEQSRVNTSCDSSNEQISPDVLITTPAESVTEVNDDEDGRIAQNV